MTGKTHKAIGVVTGVGMVLYAMETGNSLVALGLATTPFGAMLPDIDHHATELGRARVKTVKVLTQMAAIILVGVLAICIWLGFTSEKGAVEIPAFLISTIPVCGIILLVQSDFMKSRFKFAYKHRGLLHTLVIPLLLYFGASKIDTPILKYLIVGLCLGYVSHLAADSLTVSGCPLAWPLTEKPIRFARVVTNTWIEYVVAAFLGISVLAYSHLLAKNESNLYLILGIYMYTVGTVLPDKIFNKINKKLKIGGFVFSTIIPLVLLGMGWCLKSSHILLAGSMIGLGVGILLEYLRKATIKDK